MTSSLWKSLQESWLPIIHHCDDIETKWVLTPLNEKADKALITEQIHLMG
ncbi:hypothetical protein ACVRY0_00335 [Streptococcus intermedius]|jgi:hypothetical protein|nr:hypothetical protein [Streptococcus intermedius]WOI90564.1 hypothetical protein RYQ61_05945 [Streptococcus intermedius]